MMSIYLNKKKIKFVKFIPIQQQKKNITKIFHKLFQMPFFSPRTNAKQMLSLLREHKNEVKKKTNKTKRIQQQDLPFKALSGLSNGASKNKCNFKQLQFLPDKRFHLLISNLMHVNLLRCMATHTHTHAHACLHRCDKFTCTTKKPQQTET